PKTAAKLGERRLTGNPPAARMKDELVARVRKMVPRCLTANERDRFHLVSELPGWCADLDKWPAGPTTLVSIGAQRLVMEKQPDAQAAFAQAIQLAPSLADKVTELRAAIKLDKGQELLLAGNPSAADHSLSEALALEPSLGSRIAAAKAVVDLARVRELLR